MLKLKIFFILALEIFNFSFCYDNSFEPIVNSKLGRIRGSYMTTLNGRRIQAFRGIPYAKPPIGPLRFELPQKLTEMPSQLFDASKDGPACCQYDLYKKKYIGQEDCLMLNVYTSKILNNNDNVGTEKQPVMAFFHGGGFNFGSGISQIYGPRRLLDHDVVLVTLNYRLNVLGFLSTQNDALPGNIGFFDQVMALQWIQENIDAFGGDPNKVTIFGESAGGASVNYHLLSELSTGLFHAGIVMSGPLFGSWSIDYEPFRIFENLASTVGCAKLTSQEIVNCLRLLPVDELLKPLAELHERFCTPFRPVVDGVFLKDYPINLFKTGDIANKVPIIVGITKNEGSFMYYLFTNDSILDLSPQKVRKITSSVLNNDKIDLVERIGQLLKNEYFHEVGVDKKFYKTKLMQMFGDGLMYSPYYYMLELYLKAEIQPFVYSFDYKTDHSILKFHGVKELSSPTHGDDMFFLFDNQFFFHDDYTRLNDKNENIFLELWVNFAKDRDPTPNNDKKYVKWNQASNIENVQVYHLDDPIRKEKLQIDQKVVDFWMKKIPAEINSIRSIKDEF